MIVRALNTNGDFCFGRGKSDYFTLNKAIGQSIKTRLGSFINDCFFATADGIDWWYLLGSKNRMGLNLSISSIILNTPGVTGIIQLSINEDSNRALTVSYSVTTVYTGYVATSTTVVSGEVGILIDESGNVIITEDGDTIVTE
jgi:hypothetical protein